MKSKKVWTGVSIFAVLGVIVGIIGILFNKSYSEKRYFTVEKYD